MSIDWAAFWHMGGHGLYVWSGFLGTAVLLGAEAADLMRRLRSSRDEA